MNKKTIIAVLLGIAVAALLCICAGLIVYFTAANTIIPTDAENYTQLATSRASKMLSGIIITGVGCLFVFPPAVILLIIGINGLVLKIKHAKN
jgi:hypothetical protein